MKLYAFHRIFSMPDTHDFPFLRFGADIQAGGKGIPSQDQGVITACYEGIGEAPVNRPSIVDDPGGLSMHDPFGPDHLGTKGITDCLVSQADPHDWNSLMKLPDHIHADPRFLGRTGARGNEDGIRFQFPNFTGGYPVISVEHVLGNQA